MYGHMNNTTPSPRKRRVGNIGSPPKPKPKRVGLLSQIWKKIRKSPEKSRLNSLPPELVGHIGKFLPRRNLETLSRVNTRIANNMQRRAEKLRNLEIRLAQTTGGQVGKRFIQVVKNMKNVAPRNNVTLGWEKRVTNTNRLLRNLKYSHQNKNGRGNIFTRKVRRLVWRRGRPVHRNLPEYYLLRKVPAGLMVNRINIPPHFQQRPIAVNVVRNGNKLSLPL